MAQTDDDQFTTNNPDDTNPMSDMKQDQHLAHDGKTPFSTPDDTQDQLDPTSQQFDADEDGHERYDAGPDASTGVDMPGLAADEDEAPVPETEE